MSKLRKTLPPVAYWKDLRVDTSLLIQELDAKGLFATDWTAARIDVPNEENLFIQANAQCKRFFNDNDDEGYQEVNLSKPSYESSTVSKKDSLRDRFALYRTKRLDPSRPEYSEHADETKHDLPPHFLVNSELGRVATHFRGKICRVRIARLKAGASINPHVDYDPSYLFRYHIPLFTTEAAQFHTQNNEGATCNYHLPADGRVFFVNTGLLHWVSNYSNYDRLHLLIDVKGDEEACNISELVAHECVSWVMISHG